MKRGDIYWVQFEATQGSEQSGLRPALVVQQDIGNQFGPTTVVAAVTRRIPPRPYPFVVVVEPEECGLPDRSAINCAQITTIQKDGPASRLRPPRGESEVRPIGRLNAARMRDIDAALLYNLGLSTL